MLNICKRQKISSATRYIILNPLSSKIPRDESLAHLSQQNPQGVTPITEVIPVSGRAD
jgi:hypothetical protein